MSGTPAAAATMLRARRRVTPALERSMLIDRSDIFHHRADRLGPPAQLRGGDERRAALVVVIFDLAIEALEAFGGLDLAGRRNRAHGARAFAQMARAAALGPALQEIEDVQPVEDREQAAERTEKPAISAFREEPDREQCTGID